MNKQAKQLSWKEFGKKIEEDSRTTQKLFFKILKKSKKWKTN